MNLLIDTHIWVWYLSGSERLSKAARAAVEAEDAIVWLSPISIWETMILAEKGRVELKPDPTSWVRKALNSFPTREAPLTAEIAIESRAVNLSHEDPADRFLAATALVHEIPLVTADKLLTGIPGLETIS